ncbi:MAG: TetR/AcrR family transcriptional regulator [Clostridiales bacterium]|nr:TetR/AcrR family transcriptional regulator [Candidatus Crickella caballi]
MAENTSKKEIIMDAALNLFSEKGYAAVGVDEIGAAAGIKGPAIYHYFKGKEAILNELIDRYEKYYSEKFGNASGEIKVPENMEEFVRLSLARLDFTIHDAGIQKIRKLITIEQFRNKTFRKMATEHFVLNTLEINKRILSELIQKGQVKDFDPELLAFEFSAPVTTLIAMIDREPDKEEMVMAQIRKHMNHFVEIYGV